MKDGTHLVISVVCGAWLLAGCAQDTDRSGPQAKTSPAATGVAASPSGDMLPVGRVTGRIDVQGPVPILKPLVRQGQEVRDGATCGATEISDESLLVGDTGGLQNVFVYLKTKPAGYQFPQPPASEVVFDQRGCRFVPHVMRIFTGQTLRVLNADPIAHNTRTLALINAPLNRVNPPSDRRGFTIQYEHAEKIPILVTCDLHPWMRAYQLVLDHPFASTTDAAGDFTIEDLPVGEHQFRVWQERSGFLERNLTVTIEADQTTDIQLTYQPDRFDLPAEIKESKS
jgi:hypothetical protein